MHLTVVKLQFAVQEVFTPTPSPSPSSWGRGVNLMGCFSGALRLKNNPVTLFPPFLREGGPGGMGANHHHGFVQRYQNRILRRKSKLNPLGRLETCCATPKSITISPMKARQSSSVLLILINIIELTPAVAHERRKADGNG